MSQTHSPTDSHCNCGPPYWWKHFIQRRNNEKVPRGLWSSSILDVCVSLVKLHRTNLKQTFRLEFAASNIIGCSTQQKKVGSTNKLTLLIHSQPSGVESHTINSFDYILGKLLLVRLKGDYFSVICYRCRLYRSWVNVDHQGIPNLIGSGKTSYLWRTANCNTSQRLGNFYFTVRSCSLLLSLQLLNLSDSSFNKVNVLLCPEALTVIMYRQMYSMPFYFPA